MEKLKAFIFDIDGVLVDSEHANFISLKRAIEKMFAVDYTEQEEHTLGPIPTFKKLEYIVEKYSLTVSEEKKQQFLKLKFIELLDCFDQITLNPEVKDIFTFLKEQGYKIAMVSNARKVYIEKIIEELGVSGLVDIFVGNDFGLKTKPHPDMYNFVIDYFNASPRNCVIFEDSCIGLEAAQRSLANVIQINTNCDLSLELVKAIH